MTKKKAPSKKLTVKKETVERLTIEKGTADLRAGRMVLATTHHPDSDCIQCNSMAVCSDPCP